MEQQCKRGGESLRNRDVVNEEDRISELPEALLLEILSSLPTKIVIATSVLSKRWRSLWKIVPNLEFVSENPHTFSEIVCRSLILHKAPVLESLHLEVEDMRDASDVGIWMGIAFARHVRKLVLDFWYQEEGLVRFPSVLCRCNNTLEFLKLDGPIILDLPSPVSFKALKKLHLDGVEFKDEESFCNLLCGCPCLEDLFVRKVCNCDSRVYTIAVPSLQRLIMKDDWLGEGDGGYVINVPSLKIEILEPLRVQWS